MTSCSNLLSALVCIAGLSGPASAASMMDAAAAGDETVAIAQLAENPAAATEAQEDGTTALHWAIHHADLALVEALLDAGADPNARNDYGITPLAEAAIRAEADIVKALLKAGADVESPNQYGQTALMVAARTSRTDTARLLIKRGADVNARESWRGQTAIMWAAARCQPEMVRLLIRHGADPDARSRVNDWDRQVTAERRAQWRPIGGVTPLLLAAREGCLGSVEALVDGGADMDLSDPEGMVPMFTATNNFHFDVAAYLLKEGANPNRWDWRGRTPLYAAVDLNTIPSGGRPDRPTTDDTSSKELVRLLLDAGANPDIQLKLFPPYRYLKDDRGGDEVLRRGTTPLLRAAKAFDVDVVGMLLAHGARVDLPNEWGVTPLMVAAGLGQTPRDTRGAPEAGNAQERAIATLQVLLAAGADVNARDAEGQTAVFGAALWGWTSVVNFLAEHGADLDVVSAEGATPLDAAMGRLSSRRDRVGLGNTQHEDTAAAIRTLHRSPE